MYKYGETSLNYVTTEPCWSRDKIVRSHYDLVHNPNGVVTLNRQGEKDISVILKNTNYVLNSKACCENLGYKFDIETQKCYWTDIPETTSADSCNDCTTKVVYNPKNSDGTIFGVNNGETCDLTISLDYILNFDCDLFSKTCDGDTTVTTEYTTTINSLQNEITTKKAECEVITNNLANAETFFNGLCYVIRGTIPNNSNPWIDTEPFTPWDGRPIYDNDGTNIWAEPITIPNGTAEPFMPWGGRTVDTTNTSGIYNDGADIWTQPITIPNGTTGTITPTETIDIFDTGTSRFDEVPVFLTPDDVTSDIYTDGTRIRPTYLDSNTFDNIMPLGTLYNSYNFKSNTIDGSSPPFAFAWSPPSWATDAIWDPQTTWGIDSETRFPQIIRGPVPANYCLTDMGLTLWESTLGGSKFGSRYGNYVSKYGCDETTYTQTDFEVFYNKVLTEISKNYLLSTADFMVETTQQLCDKNVAFNNYTALLISSENCTTALNNLNTQLTTTKNDLTTFTQSNPGSSPIPNLENLKVFLNLEVEQTKNVYKSIYEESIFNIGSGNLLNFILNESPNTGILISGATANGILRPPFSFDLYDGDSISCETGRDEFIKQLYLTQYKGVYPDPTTPDEQLELNKKMNNWYNSSWLYYNKKLDNTITSQIINKKIKISLRIENCCLDLCILTDNLALTKSCESLENQEIIISKSPEFEIERVMDNRKSWVSYTETNAREHDLQFRETQYSVDDYRLTINTKEIDLKIDGANAIEEDVLCIVDCLISGATGPAISGTCCPDTCDLGYVANYTDYYKSINKGKARISPNTGYPIGYAVEPPTFKALDTYQSPTGYDTETVYKEYSEQGIWKPYYPKTNVHFGCSNSAIDIIEGTTGCDEENYMAFNRAARDNALRWKNELLLATDPFDWANLYVIQFQIEKYYLNQPCSISEYNVGEYAKGGIVAYVDGTGQHGLICTSIPSYYNRYWHASDSDLVSATADGLYSGITNTNAILSAYGTENNAATFCSGYSTTDYAYVTYDDWYLPSKYELNIISQNWRNIGIILNDTTYVWTSTENNSSTAWAQNIFSGEQKIYNKSTLLGVIAVRKF